MTLTAVVKDDLLNYYVFWKDVIALTGSSEMTIRRAIERGDFPPQVKLFGRKGRVGFRRADIYLWCEGRWSPEGGV